MIDRNDFDLRMADHAAVTACINNGDWRRQGEANPHAIRAALAAALVALAAQLAPTNVKRFTQPV